MSELVKPYDHPESGKKEQVRTMFNNISGRYDFLNHFLSFGIDRRWRRRAISELRFDKPGKILDVATGTGDFAIECLTLSPEKVIGIDIAENMLKEGMRKMRKKGFDSVIELRRGDSEQLDFPDDHFDAVTVAFGVRNFEDLKKGLTEIRRVLKIRGKLVVLEFSKPKSFPLKQLFNFYFSRILPVIGSVISRDKRAYFYLRDSVAAFPEGNEFIRMLKEIGYSEVRQIRLMDGIASIYVGKK